MKAIIFTTAIVAVVAAFTFCYAMPQSYQVNVHFIPALVSGSCSIGQFWAPSNVSCAMCFCLTGRVSRCVPQPGCMPGTNATSTTTSTPSSIPNFPNVSSNSSTVPDPNAPTAATTPSTTAKPVVKVRRHAKIPAIHYENENQ